ncbi:tetratricopeptide repeat protein [Streptomyces xiangluensis]|uniref:Tetratricopeptide repeat protein n=1 Tax=Streptomyces xiangluensis TaxID=2665720 RepID=A0ABV8YUK8_9ACTN
MNATDARVTVTDTGNATAASGATAVTGYRGPASGTGGGAGSPVRVSGTGAATASQGGLANTGYIHQVSAEQLTMMQHRARREPAPWPHQVGVIPPRARCFQDRAEADRLRAVVNGGGTAVLHQVPIGQILAGMGGVGKTQLAADYARTAWHDDDLDVLVWITASARSPVLTGYAQAGVELCRADPNDPEQAAQTFLAWLTPKTGAEPCRWLIVLDDVADPDDLRGLWPPASPYGRTLVTTRRRDAALMGEGRRLIEVGLFTEAEAIAHLTAFLAAHSRSEPADQLAALAADLGYLPLALAQAAAYLIDSSEDVAAYRALLADRTITLADTTPDRLPDDQCFPLAAAWSLSIDRADRLRPAGVARPMLHLAALLDPNGIPEDVLTSQPVLIHLARHRTPIGQDTSEEAAPVSPRDAVRALRTLHRLSLIHHTSDTPHQAVRVHQLIQRATRDTLTADQHDQYARTAADALTAAWPKIERDIALVQALRGNTAVLYNVAQQALWQPNGHPALFRTGTSLGEAGQVTTAITYWQHMVSAASRCLGPDHPDALTARHRLTHWKGFAGDLATAVAELQRLLPDQQRVLGPDHTDTLTTLHDLARWRGAAGDLTGTIAAFEGLLNDRIRVLGPEHLDTVDTRHDLAYWRGKAGDPARAVTELKESLRHFVQALGPDHDFTLMTRGNIATFQGEAGDPAAAASAFEDLLEDDLRVLGPDHLFTLESRYGFAVWRGKAGDPVTAATELEELIADMLRAGDPTHPLLSLARRALAHCRGEAGDPAAAVTTLEESLSDPRRGYGPDHPDTLGARRDLAVWRGKTGDPVTAAAELGQVVSDMLRVLGPTHPETLKARHDLDHWRGKAEEGMLGSDRL